MLTAALLLVGAAMCVLGTIALVAANQAVDDMSRRLRGKDARIAQLLDDLDFAVEAAARNADHAERRHLRSVPKPTDPPIYLDALAWSEAARADWDEPMTWGQS